jgi:hypothetical protein
MGVMGFDSEDRLAQLGYGGDEVHQAAGSSGWELVGLQVSLSGVSLGGGGVQDIMHR